MTTYHLRSASPAKTRSDVVVVGALQSGKDVRLAAGAEDVAEAYGRKLRLRVGRVVRRDGRVEVE